MLGLDAEAGAATDFGPAGAAFTCADFTFVTGGSSCCSSTGSSSTGAASVVSAGDVAVVVVSVVVVSVGVV